MKFSRCNFCASKKLTFFFEFETCIVFISDVTFTSWVLNKSPINIDIYSLGLFYLRLYLNTKWLLSAPFKDSFLKKLVYTPIQECRNWRASNSRYRISDKRLSNLVFWINFWKLQHKKCSYERAITFNSKWTTYIYIYLL